ncbi:hypothetical protein D3C78_1456460 [compost metagenome]
MTVLGHLHHPEKARPEVLAQDRLGPGKVTAYVQDDEPLVGADQGGYLLDHPLGIVGPVAVEGQHRVVLLGPDQGRSVN